MRILIIGDTHFHNWDFPLNEYQKKFLFEILPELVDKEKPETIVFLGDIFESKTNVDKKILSEVIEGIGVLQTKVLNIFIIAGNHDYYSITEGVTLPFKGSNIQVITKPKVTTLNGFRVGFVPWVPNAVDSVEVKAVIKDSDIIFSHLDIADIPYSPYAKIKAKNALGLPEFNGKIVFNGHYHIPGTYGSVVNVGSIAQFDISEIGTKKRLCLFDSKTDELKNVPLPHPQFVIVERIEEYNYLKEKQDFNIIPYYDVSKIKKPSVDLKQNINFESTADSEDSPMNLIELTLSALRKMYESLPPDDKKLVTYEELEDMVKDAYFERSWRIWK